MARGGRRANKGKAASSGAARSARTPRPALNGAAHEATPVPTHTMCALRAAGKVGADNMLTSDAFRNDASVVRIVLPEGVVGVADGSWGFPCKGAFSGCLNLVEVVLPASCTSIGVCAF